MEPTKEVLAYLKYHNKLIILKHAKQFGVNKFLKDFKIPKSTYYKWKKAFDKEGPSGLLKKHPVAYSHPNKIKQEVVDNW